MRDLRRYAQQTQVRLLLGGLFLLFIVGDGLILIFYGKGAALFGLVCLVLGLAPVGLIILFLAVADWILKRADQGEQWKKG